MCGEGRELGSVSRRVWRFDVGAGRKWRFRWRGALVLGERGARAVLRQRQWEDGGAR